MRRCRRLERFVLERREVVIAGSGLDDPAALSQVCDEAFRASIDRLRPIGTVPRVVHVAVEAGRSDDVESGLPCDRGEGVDITAEAQRRPVDERASTCSDERLRLGDRLVEVEEPVARLRRRVQEKMLVCVARAEVGGVDVPEHRADDHASIRPNRRHAVSTSASAQRQFTVAGNASARSASPRPAACSARASGARKPKAPSGRWFR